jgi:hypothetical protein
MPDRTNPARTARNPMVIKVRMGTGMSIDSKRLKQKPSRSEPVTLTRKVPKGMPKKPDRETAAETAAGCKYIEG